MDIIEQVSAACPPTLTDMNAWSASDQAFSFADPPRVKRVKGPPREKRKSKAKMDKERKWAKYDYMVPPADPDETWFRHYNWQAKRDRIRKALCAAWTSEFAMNRWDECGGECLVEWSESEQRHRLRANYCHNRHCEPCQKAKAAVLSKNLQKRLEVAPEKDCRYRFITLTIRHDRNDSLKDLITQLYTCFAALRKDKCWKESQLGGCSILEVKWSFAGGWHPHLHIAAEGQFLRQETLKKAWQRITHGSYKADIRAIKETKDVVFYVSKYIGKGINDEVWGNENAAVEYITAMKGVRMCATFGSWRGFALLAQDKANDAKDWNPVGLLKTIAHNARQGSMVDILLLQKLEEALQYNPHKRRNTTKSSEPPG